MSGQRSVKGRPLRLSQVNAAHRFADLADRLFDALRHPHAFELGDSPTSGATFACLDGYRYATLVTFRRDGTPVPSPVWFALAPGPAVYVKTRQSAGKVKRLRSDSRVVLVGSTMRGRPLGPCVPGSARVMAPSEWPVAEHALRGAYGAGRRIAEATLSDDDVAYIEIRPRR